jgi:hypothetical protein
LWRRGRGGRAGAAPARQFPPPRRQVVPKKCRSWWKRHAGSMPRRPCSRRQAAPTAWLVQRRPSLVYDEPRRRGLAPAHPSVRIAASICVTGTVRSSRPSGSTSGLRSLVPFVRRHGCARPGILSARTGAARRSEGCHTHFCCSRLVTSYVGLSFAVP